MKEISLLNSKQVNFHIFNKLESKDILLLPSQFNQLNTFDSNILPNYIKKIQKVISFIHWTNDKRFKTEFMKEILKPLPQRDSNNKDQELNSELNRRIVLIQTTLRDYCKGGEKFSLSLNELIFHLDDCDKEYKIFESIDKSSDTDNSKSFTLTQIHNYLFNLSFNNKFKDNELLIALGKSFFNYMDIINLRRMKEITSTILVENQKLNNNKDTNDLFLLKNLFGRITRTEKEKSTNSDGTITEKEINISYCNGIVKPGQEITENTKLVEIITAKHCYISHKAARKFFYFNDDSNSSEDYEFEAKEVCINNCSKFISLNIYRFSQDKNLIKNDEDDYGEIKVSIISLNGKSLYELLKERNLIKNGKVLNFNLQLKIEEKLENSENNKVLFDLYFVYGSIEIKGYPRQNYLIPNILRKDEFITNGSMQNNNYLIKSTTYKDKIILSGQSGVSGSPLVGCAFINEKLECKLLGSVKGGTFNEKEKTGYTLINKIK